MDAAFPLWLRFLAKQGRGDSGMISQAGLLLIRKLYLTGSSLSSIRLHFFQSRLYTTRSISIVLALIVTTSNMSQ